VGSVGPASALAPERGWGWPLDPRPAVLARFDPPQQTWGAGHRGVDLAAAVGQPVLAPSAGVVTFSGVVVDRGVLVVTAASGLRSSLEPVTGTVSVGTPVARGQVVGQVSAATGHCDPVTCLHWGVLRAETYLDPLTLVGTRRVVLLPLRPP
ncbi:MAG: peptidoglycan DD-metalloendopeptidase family protein, partial [Lapillicoccus sp.]